MYSAQYERGEIDGEAVTGPRQTPAPAAEHAALWERPPPCRSWRKPWGLPLPGSALLPATSPDLMCLCQARGALRPCSWPCSRLAAQRHRSPWASFENAIVVHAAISGSTNTSAAYTGHCPRAGDRHRRAERLTGLHRRAPLSARSATRGKVARRVLLLCRRRPGHHGRDSPISCTWTP